jgi:pimeloyl-ACP methyl ester carboxylesterase
MGSLVAQLIWRRHPDRVLGAVLCASTTGFVEPGRDPRLLRLVAERTARSAANHLLSREAAPWAPGMDVNRWALAQFRSTTGRRVTGAAAQIARFDSSRWIGEMSVPTAVVVNTRDRLIAPQRQRRLARLLPDATVYEVDAGHAACVLATERFRPALLAAAASVAVRSSVRARS